MLVERTGHSFDVTTVVVNDFKILFGQWFVILMNIWLVQNIDVKIHSNTKNIIKNKVLHMIHWDLRN